MGTPEFSVPILKSIHNSKHNVIEVYTQPPKKKNRGQLINFTPIHEFSNKNNIKVRYPDQLNTEEEINNLKDEVFKGNKVKTNKLLNDTLIEQEKINYYLNLINQRLYKLNEVQIMSKNGGLEKSISNLKPPIFWKDKENFTIQAKRWGQNKIKYILDKSYDLEINIKSNSTINKNILFKKLLVDICDTANS